MMNVYHIPDYSHDPPNSFNPLFDTFKGDFGESLRDNRMLYIEFSRVFMVIKSFGQLTEWVNNQQKTQAMLQLFDKQDNPPKRENNAIKTFKQPRNPPQQQNRFQAKPNKPFTFNKNNQSQFYQARRGAIPKQYSKPVQNQNIGQQRNFNPNFRQMQN